MKATSKRGRLLALLLAVVMLVGLLPTMAASAASTEYYLTSSWKNRIYQHYGIGVSSMERISFVKWL